MKILITGVCGMIGSEVAERLLAQGHELIGCDDLSHNAIEPKSLNIRMFTCQVHQLLFFDHALGDIDLLIHCASPVGHARLVPEAHVAWSIIQDTQAMLELAERKNARLITFSSSEVLTYKGETDIRAQYSLGKLTSEAMALGHPKVDARVIRPYNVTGKRQRADGGFVMARFRDQVLKGEPLTVFGDGKQVRHFLHVSDFAAFVLLLIEKWPERERWSVFNPQNKVTVEELADHFVGAQIEAIHRGVNGAGELSNPHWRDSAERPLAIEEFEACWRLGWRPQVTLGDMIREHLEAVREA